MTTPKTDVQTAMRRPDRRITYVIDGEELTLGTTEWAKRLNINESTLRWRTRQADWTDAQILGFEPRPAPHEVVGRSAKDTAPEHSYAKGEVPVPILLDLIRRPQWENTDYALFVAQLEGSIDRWRWGEGKVRHGRITKLVCVENTAHLAFLRGEEALTLERSKLCRSLLAIDLLLYGQHTPELIGAAESLLRGD